MKTTILLRLLLSATLLLGFTTLNADVKKVKNLKAQKVKDDLKKLVEKKEKVKVNTPKQWRMREPEIEYQRGVIRTH